MDTQTIEETRKKIFSIVKDLEPVELKSLENYAEFLAQRNNEAKFIDILRTAEPEDEELDKSEIEGIKRAKEEFKKGQFRELKDYLKDRGLL